MKNTITTILILLSANIFAQIINAPTVKNVNLNYNGSEVQVFYDLSGIDKNETYVVDVKFYKANKSQLINAVSLSGDIGKVSPGIQKQILWDIKKDEIYLNDEIFVKITAAPKVQVPLLLHVGKSTVFPGWGGYRLREKPMPYLLYGLSAAACLTGSIIMNKKASDTYTQYKESKGNVNEVDNLFTRSQNYQTASYVFAGTAGAIWAVDIAGLIRQYRNIKNRKAVSEDNFYIKKSEDEKLLAQSFAKHINTKEAIKPPYLVIEQTSIKYADQDGNYCLNANEKAVIQFDVKNIGEGSALNVYVNAELKSKQIKGLSIDNHISIGEIKPNELKSISIPLTSDKNIETAKNELSFVLKEANDFDSDPASIVFQSLEFQEPEIIIADHQFTTETGGNAELGKVLNLKMIVQNIGQGVGENIKLEMNLPAEVTEIGDRYFYIDKLNPNEKKEINFEFIAKKSYAQPEINIRAYLSEKEGKYAHKNNAFTLPVNQELSETKVSIEANVNTTDIEIASLKSDIDVNIPKTNSKGDDKYALIIGNEDYSNYQEGITSESDVEFAVNDAKLFKEYLVKTFGVPDKNITFLENATASQTKQAITKIQTIAEIRAEKAEIIFYYAGHGLPDEQNKEPYIIPVDVSSSNITDGIKLFDVYRDLTKHSVKQVTCFVDACFSGGARNGSLLSARSVKIRPRSDALFGNIVVFTSSSGEESSMAYKDKYHGMFTYYLLKKIQETKGNITFGELHDYLKDKVSIESININSKKQTPGLLFAPDMSEKWRKLKL